MKLHTNILLKAGAFMLLLLFCLIGTSQERFNVRFDSGFPNTILSSVIEVEGGYVSTGFLGDSVNANATPMIFSKFDSQGNQLFQETYGGFNDYQFWSQNPDLQFLNDTTIIHSGVTFDNEGIRLGYLMKSNLNGDTLETLRFYSPNYPEDLDYSSLFPIRLEQSADNNFLILSGINNTETGNDRMIQKFTPEGELLWTYEYATEQDPDYVNTIIPTSDGGGVSAAALSIIEGESSNLHFFKYTTNGNLEWEFFTNPNLNLGVIRDALLDDKYLLCASAEVRHEEFDGIPAILKIDTLGNISWITSLWEDDYSQYHKYEQIVKAQDGNYVSGGVYGVGSSFLESSSAYLAKVNTEGELLWQRKYKYFDLGNDQHELRDLKATSDGGFIFCGEAKGTDEDNPEVTGPYQQGWLVKVDSYGCLVEGCHLSDNVSEIEKQENKEYFKVGPIPASQFLNIYQAQQVSPLAVYELYDFQGRLIKAIPIADLGTTLMVDISDLSSGNYVLSLREGSQLLQSKKMTFD